MPTYEYRCDACGHEFEKEQRITAERLKKCPRCRKLKLTRLVGTGHFILKGGGWYADGYGSKKPEADKSEGKPGSDGGGDAKPGTDKTDADKTGAKKSGTEKSDAKKTDAKKSSD